VYANLPALKIYNFDFQGPEDDETNLSASHEADTERLSSIDSMHVNVGSIHREISDSEDAFTKEDNTDAQEAMEDFEVDPNTCFQSKDAEDTNENVKDDDGSARSEDNKCDNIGEDAEQNDDEDVNDDVEPKCDDLEEQEDVPEQPDEEVVVVDTQNVDQIEQRNADSEEEDQHNEEPEEELEKESTEDMDDELEHEEDRDEQRGDEQQTSDDLKQDDHSETELPDIVENGAHEETLHHQSGHEDDSGRSSTDIVYYIYTYLIKPIIISSNM